MARPTGRDIRTEVIDEARSAVQQSGVSALSYGPLAERIGIRAPSIHYHFRHKQDLIREVSAAYCDDFAARVRAIDDTTAEPEGAPTSATERLRAYAALFDEVARDGRLCLCGAVAADWADVDEDSRAIVRRFFDDQTAWLARQFAAAIEADEIATGIEPSRLAETTLTLLEGSLLLSRAAGPDGQASRSLDTLLTTVRPSQPSRPSQTSRPDRAED